jgi:hypothetical protein
MIQDALRVADVMPEFPPAPCSFFSRASHTICSTALALDESKLVV